MHPVHKYVLNACSVPGPVLGDGVHWCEQGKQLLPSRNLEQSDYYTQGCLVSFPKTIKNTSLQVLFIRLFFGLVYELVMRWHLLSTYQAHYK